MSSAPDPDLHRSYDLGPHVNEHYAFLREVLVHGSYDSGFGLEFGVGGGTSLREIAAYMPAIGFDSFEGLPEDWRDGFPRGSFACDPPAVLAALVIGLYEDTLPAYDFAKHPIALVHIDCDLYSSTATVLEHVGPHLKPGCLVVFDEWHGYEGCEEHEQRAWREYAADHPGLRWEVIGHSFQQWGVRIV